MRDNDDDVAKKIVYKDYHVVLHVCGNSTVNLDPKEKSKTSNYN